MVNAAAQNSRAPWYAHPSPLCWPLLVGFGLRLLLLDRFPLREDEAIYGYWALAWRHLDPHFLAIWPDKPPLFLWMQAGAFQLFGASAPAARLVNIAADTLTIVVVAQAARQLRGPTAAFWAATLYALSPFAVSFAPTGYTDPFLVLAGMGALTAALAGRGLAAGLLLGVAIMTKQQGVLYTPLIFGVLVVHGTTRRREVLLALAGLLAVAAPLVWWDSQRWAVAPSPWDLSVRNYGRLALAPPGDWLQRLTAWVAVGRVFAASFPVWLLLAPLIVLGVAGRMRGSVAMHLLAGWGVAYGLLHLVTTVQVWDRYLLPLAPLLALAAGVGLAALRPQWRLWVGGLLLLLMLGPAWQGANGGLPVGGDHGAYSGLEDALAWVDAQAPAVLYQREIGWQAQFYLFSSLMQAPPAERVQLRWFPHTVYLADNLAKTPAPPAFVVQPDWAPLPHLRRALAARGLTLEQSLRSGHFVVYRVHHNAAPCDWCLCRLPRSPWVEIETDAASRSRPSFPGAD